MRKRNVTPNFLLKDEHLFLILLNPAVGAAFFEDVYRFAEILL
jgi:hypothetical protein